MNQPRSWTSVTSGVILGGIASIALTLAGCDCDREHMHQGAYAPVSSTPDRAAVVRQDDGSVQTAIDQGMGEVDTNLTRNIRTAVMAERNLSVSAQNVTVITKDRQVTLRGQVASESERSTVVAIAIREAGVGMVNDRLAVVAK